MAPTTLSGQVTTTCPFGRNNALVGWPIRMSELLSSLQTPAYIERVSVHDPKHIVQAKRAIKKAFTLQKAGKCFTLVEVLSTCPTNWGLTPSAAQEWLKNNMLAYYPLGCYKDYVEDGGGQ